MALSKEITLPNGVVAPYWRIVDASIDKQTMIARFRIGLFMSRDIARTGVEPFCDEMFSFSVIDSDIASDFISLGYSKIKDSIAAEIYSGKMAGAVDA